MAFEKDAILEAETGNWFGDYLTTFISSQGQVRADLFRRGKVVEAHVSFSPGVDAATATDPYISALWAYAREQGVADKFEVILS